MKKEEKIREEWIKAIGYFPDDCCKETGYISDNSNSVYNYFEDFCLNKEDFDFKSEIYGSLIRWRPNTLQGIENNNGWIPVTDKLPSVGDRIISRRDLCEKIFEEIETVTNEFLIWYDMNNITHWKPYESKPPIY